MTWYWYGRQRLSSRRATSSRRWMASSVSVPRPRSRRSNSSSESGRTKIVTASGILLAQPPGCLRRQSLRLPISRRESRGDLAPQRAVPVAAAENLDTFQKIATPAAAAQIPRARGSGSPRRRSRPAAAAAWWPKHSAPARSACATEAAAPAWSSLPRMGPEMTIDYGRGWEGVIQSVTKQRKHDVRASCVLAAFALSLLTPHSGSFRAIARSSP